MANILIVEDDLLNMEMISELLENAGHKVSKAENFHKCIECTSQLTPDLILMDLNLPEVNGFQATKLLKQKKETQTIPIVALTALVMPHDKQKAFESGCCGFIAKPVEVKSFIKTVDNFIKHSKLYSPAFIQTGSSFEPATDKQIKIDEDDKCCKHNVLIIDDNEMNAEMLKETVEQIGNKAIAVNSGLKALNLLKKNNYDLIMLDIMMPDMNGFEVIRKIKSDPKTAEIPVVFVSALDETKDIVEGFNLGSYEYITKPFNVEELKARVKSILKIKDLQDALKSEKKILNLIFNFSADGILMLNSNLEIVSCNEKASQWIGLNKAEIIDKNFFSILNIDSSSSLFTKNNENQNSFCLELQKNNDDQKIFLEVNYSEVNSSSNKLKGYVLILRDVTSQKEIEAQKETFVATLTHDLKTPVRAQMKALELIISGKFGNLNQNQVEMLQETLNSNKYMFSMLDNLLTTYKYENGTIKVLKDNFSLKNLLNNCVNEIKYLANDKQQIITISKKDDDIDVYADAIEIKRVITNLIGNAINYTEENGKIAINIEQKNNFAYISIQDNGRGIAKQDMPSLFNRYQSHAKKFRQVGTGLGLYLSKKIIENHGGEITVESEEGVGSTFTVSIPVK